MANYVTLRIAKERLGLCGNTLRKYADNNQIKTIRSPAGHRLFDCDSFCKETVAASVICYCRVSSAKQRDDLTRQVAYMREQFPHAEIIKDIGSGLNFKRKGLKALLQRLLQGDKLTVVVAHRDRLARFGFELIEYLVKERGGEVMVLDQSTASPSKELTEDLLAILHVFSCRMHGLRKYSHQIKEDKNLSEQAAKTDL